VPFQQHAQLAVSGSGIMCYKKILGILADLADAGGSNRNTLGTLAARDRHGHRWARLQNLVGLQVFRIEPGADQDHV
jgi:hypothetical protein